MHDLLARQFIEGDSGFYLVAKTSNNYIYRWQKSNICIQKIHTHDMSPQQKQYMKYKFYKQLTNDLNSDVFSKIHHLTFHKRYIIIVRDFVAGYSLDSVKRTTASLLAATNSQYENKIGLYGVIARILENIVFNSYINLNLKPYKSLRGCIFPKQLATNLYNALLKRQYDQIPRIISNLAIIIIDYDVPRSSMILCENIQEQLTPAMIQLIQIYQHTHSFKLRLSDYLAGNNL